jgi:hypothetical protein
MKKITTHFILLILFFCKINISEAFAEIMIENISQNQASGQLSSDSKLVVIDINKQKYPQFYNQFAVEDKIKSGHGLSLSMSKNFTFKNINYDKIFLLSEVFYIKNFENNHYNSISQIAGLRLMVQENLLKIISHKIQNFHFGIGANLIFIDYNHVKQGRLQSELMPNISIIKQISKNYSWRLNYLGSGGLLATKSSTGKKIYINNLDLGLCYNF